MKNCGNCGAPMNDADIICQNCGARSAPVMAAPKKAGVKMPDLKKLPKKYLGIGAIVVAALVVILLATLIFGSSYKDALDNTFAVSFKGNYNKIAKLAPEGFWKAMDEQYDTEYYKDYNLNITAKEVIKELKDDDHFEEIIDNYQDKYGKNFKATYKIKDKDELSKKDFKALKEAIHENYDIPKDDIKKAYKLDYEVFLKGKEDDDDYEVEDAYVVKIKGSWYAVSHDGRFAAEDYVSVYVSLNKPKADKED